MIKPRCFHPPRNEIEHSLLKVVDTVEKLYYLDSKLRLWADMTLEF